MLAEELIAEIEASGPIRFDAFMGRALFDSRHGYYASGRARIGRQGDFYTNVSVGRMFGRVIAAQCAEIWERLGQPAEFDLIEQGANDGRFAADMLAALQEDHAECFAATRYTLIEPFSPLAVLQHATLRGWSEKLRWEESLDALPRFTGVHFTNEYVDALPVRLFVRQSGIWFERHVAVRQGCLRFEDRPAPEAPPDLPGEIDDGYLAEYRPEATSWIDTVAARLTRGAMLVVDYGFSRSQLYAPWRTAGTLSCYRKHRRDDNPLEAPGEKDLTAHVDFTDLAEAGLAAELDLAGFTDQYHFLVGAATPLLLAMETAPASPQRDADLRAIKTLLHPEMMGTQFKYLALTRGLDLSTPLAGFRHASPPHPTLGLTQNYPVG